MGDQQRQKASRLSRIARIIRLRQYDAEFINQMGHGAHVKYLNSKYASYACQSDSDSIYPLFAWEFGLTAISEPAPGGWSEPGPKLEARRLINFVRSYAKFSAEPFMQVSGL